MKPTLLSANEPPRPATAPVGVDYNSGAGCGVAPGGRVEVGGGRGGGGGGVGVGSVFQGVSGIIGCSRPGSDGQIGVGQQAGRERPQNSDWLQAGEATRASTAVPSRPVHKGARGASRKRISSS